MLADSLPHTRKTLVIAFLLLLGSLGAALLAAPRAQAVLVPGGPVCNVTWDPSNNPYIVQGHVTVPFGCFLTILPGTIVRFEAGIGLWVDGLLTADGALNNEIQFLPNTLIIPLPWRGIQFNATATGSVTWSIFDRSDVAILVDGSSPLITNNLVRSTTFVGFYLAGSSSLVYQNTILRGGFVGIYTFGGTPDIIGNAVNGTAIGIESEGAATPIIAGNVVTNVSSTFAVGIYTTLGVSAQIYDNILVGILGARGGNGVAAGDPGGPGGIAVGILTVGAPWVGIWNNDIASVYGGRGGNGRENGAGNGGAGGPGGSAAGIVTSGTPAVDMSGNRITNVVGGRGGDGGGGGTTARGGNGGAGGGVAGLQTFDATTSAFLYSFDVNGLTGGPGGNGGAGTLSVGMGGDGGEAYGIFTWNARNADANWNSIVDVAGGLGGNSTASATGRVAGGSGGDASGIAQNFVSHTAWIRSSFVSQVAGGQGGRGATGGVGGSATGAFAFGTGIGGFNQTTVSFNWIEFLTGGEGGLGDRIGGPGGSANGIAGAAVLLVLSGNGVWTLAGGGGGDALDGSDAGRGGDASGVLAIQVPKGSSTLDWLFNVNPGAPGVGGPVPASYATGFYAVGTPSTRTAFTIENATIGTTGTFDIAVDIEADVTTISTAFDGARVQIGAAGTLTVRNYLGVSVYWPDGLTPVAGSRIRVRDNAMTTYDFVSASGAAQWLLITDRVYVNSNTATENTTEAEVSYLSFNFLSNPRTNIVMASDTSETFIMDDQAAPTSSVDLQPTYRTTLAFNVSYTASDGNGTGLRDVTLWYRLNGTGGWIAFATQPAAASGRFAFVAPSDGTYEFTTTVDDNAGNKEPGPSANDTWTIVDTTRPGSHVNPLPTYTNTSSFVVSWAPDAGVTDIAFYTIQYRRNGGPWTNWLAGTILTSATFAADPPSGLYEFRSIATDAAGNVELPPAVNDSWTFVDIAAPLSSVRALSMYQTSLDFTVTWGPDFDTTDIASYRIDVSDNGGAWTVWFAATTSISALFTGLDGHRYAFRSIATDFAGNVEPAPAGNDTYTIVDVTAPMSAVASLPTYTITATISLSWAPAGGTTDIATYTLEVSDNGGAWTSVVGYVGTTLTTGSYTPIDGRTYAFRTVATDRAGNVESVAGNDTWTIVDRTAPVSSHSLSGTAGTNPWYVGPVTVSLTAADTTSGILSITYRIDGGAFLTYSVPFVVSGDGSHTVEYFAVDGAGWTEPLRNVVVRIDTTTPTTSASPSGTSGTGGWFRSNVIVTLSASDASSGVASTSYRIDGGSWQAYTGPFIVSGDGTHAVEYRSTDRAGLVESAGSSAVNIDATAPSVVPSLTTPRGSNVNLTPAIVITFSEPMDQASVEAAFSITPDMNGAFTWSADSRTLTFTPERALDPSTTYGVFVDSGARDAAGNPLSGAYTFSFTTAAAPAGFGFGDSWWILALIAGIGAGLFFVMMRRRSVAAASKPALAPIVAPKRSAESTIDDVFLLYRDGLLIKHDTRRLKPDIDTDILSGMLTAVQQFVKDSFRSEEGDLDELTFGQMHILIGRGKWVILAAMIQGDGTDAMMEQVKRCVGDIEDHQWDQLDGWDGDMAIAKVLSPYVKKLVRGEYA